MKSVSDIWNPDAYLGFANDRVRPALELILRIETEIKNPVSIVDLGCGPGNVTAILRDRWKDAIISGVDNSPAMLDRARAEYPDKNINWKLENINDWVLDKQGGKFDVIFSNAALHWLGGHKDLFPQLMDRVAAGGVLAVQMPNNFSAPSHKLISKTVGEGPWADELKSVVKSSSIVWPIARPVAWPAAYKGWLHPYSKNVEVWETHYIQHFDGDDPVLKWISSTALAPILGALKGVMQESFLAVYARRLREAYPKDADGRTVYKMRRTFILALKD